jgi:isochorismate hydrolase
VTAIGAHISPDRKERLNMGIPSIAPYTMPAASQVPANQAHWRCDPARAALLIHDMQHYFLNFFHRGQPPLSTLIHNIQRLRQAAAAAGVPVLYTAQPGGMTRQERGLLMDIWGPGMSKDPEEREIVPELAPAPEDIVITKWRYSAFARSDLAAMLRRLERDQLIVCGVYAHVGCLMTACDAFTEDIQPFLPADAIADFSPEYHQLALRYAAERCAVTPTTQELLERLAQPAPRNVASGRSVCGDA